MVKSKMKAGQAAVSAVDGGMFQSIARLDLLLSTLSTNQEEGLKLMDVCRLTGLGKATTHRLLSGLVAYRLADYDPGTARYFVGFKVLAWASGAGNRYGLARMAAPSIRRLATLFEDAVYLSIRLGDEAVCVERLEGAFPIKTLAFKIGDHRPLGIGAGSAAMLAALSEEEIERVLKEGAAARHAFKLSDKDLRVILGEASRQGYSFVEGLIVPGISTVGVPILLDDQSPIAAISVSAISDRMKPARRLEIADAIAAEVATIVREFGPLLTSSDAMRLAAAAR